MIELNNYNNELLFEHRFWLQILGDHARFIISALPSTEMNLVQKSNYFKSLFDNLLNNSRKNLDEKSLHELTILSYKAAVEIRQFKLYIISRQISNKIEFNLPPTFVNHMVNEVEEYIHVLNAYMNTSNTYSMNPLHYHLLWLPDASGHAMAISSHLDMIEKELAKIGDQFAEIFKNLFFKAFEFKGYTRTGLTKFPSLDNLNRVANSEIEVFKRFLEDLKLLIMEKQVLGTLSPLMPDHMYREECYYQIKLSQTSNIKSPACDPTKPRIQE